MTIHTNIYGRTWDDFDALRARVFVRSMIPDGPRSFTVVSRSGSPLLGELVDSDPLPPLLFTAQEWL